MCLEISKNSQENTYARVSFLRTPFLIEHLRWLLLYYSKACYKVISLPQNFTLDHNKNYRQKQPLRGILRKMCSENMQQIYRRHPCRSATSMKLLCNSVEIALQHGCSPVNLLHIFRTSFPKRHVTRRRGEIQLFLSTRTFNLGLKTENFDPRVKWISWPFCMIFYMFHFIKYRYFKRSVISFKLEKKKIAVFIDSI